MENYKSFEKIERRVFKPLWIRKSWRNYNQEFIKLRGKNNQDRCFCCNVKFREGDNLNLSCFKNIANKLLCDFCTTNLEG